MFNHPVISADGHMDHFRVCRPRFLPTMLRPTSKTKCLGWLMPRTAKPGWPTTGPAWVLVGGMGSAGRQYIPGQIHRADRMAATGLYEDQSKGIMRTTVPELRIKDQERDGVVGEVIYGILGAAFRIDDPEVTDTVVRIYNDFAADFCRAAPGRFAAVASLPASSPENTAEEVRRCAKMGLKGAELPRPSRHDAAVASGLGPGLGSLARHRPADSSAYHPVPSST